MSTNCCKHHHHHHQSRVALKEADSRSSERSSACGLSPPPEDEHSSEREGAWRWPEEDGVRGARPLASALSSLSCHQSSAAPTCRHERLRSERAEKAQTAPSCCQSQQMNIGVHLQDRSRETLPVYVTVFLYVGTGFKEPTRTKSTFPPQ